MASGGAPLSGPALRRHPDLAGVRVHRGAAAQRGARLAGADAFALGDHVFVSRAAQLDHELGHVRQQRREGRVLLDRITVNKEKANWVYEAWLKEYEGQLGKGNPEAARRAAARTRQQLGGATPKTWRAPIPKAKPKPKPKITSHGIKVVPDGDVLRVLLVDEKGNFLQGVAEVLPGEMPEDLDGFLYDNVMGTAHLEVQEGTTVRVNPAAKTVVTRRPQEEENDSVVRMAPLYSDGSASMDPKVEMLLRAYSNYRDELMEMPSTGGMADDSELDAALKNKDFMDWLENKQLEANYKKYYDEQLAKGRSDLRMVQAEWEIISRQIQANQARNRQLYDLKHHTMEALQGAQSETLLAWMATNPKPIRVVQPDGSSQVVYRMGLPPGLELPGDNSYVEVSEENFAKLKQTADLKSEIALNESANTVDQYEGHLKGRGRTSRVLDAAYGAELKGASWPKIREAVTLGREALARGDRKAALKYLQQARRLTAEARKEWGVYEGRRETGANVTIKALEMVETTADVSLVLLSAGTAAPLVVGGKTVMTAAQVSRAIVVGSGMVKTVAVDAFRDASGEKVDWGDTVFNVTTQVGSAALGGGLDKVFAKAPMANQLITSIHGRYGKAVAENVVQSVIVQAAVAQAQAWYSEQKREGKNPTEADFAAVVQGYVSDPTGLPLDLVTSLLGLRAPGTAHVPDSPPTSGPSGTQTAPRPPAQAPRVAPPEAQAAPAAPAPAKAAPKTPSAAPIAAPVAPRRPPQTQVQPPSRVPTPPRPRKAPHAVPDKPVKAPTGVGAPTPARPGAGARPPAAEKVRPPAPGEAPGMPRVGDKSTIMGGEHDVSVRWNAETQQYEVRLCSDKCGRLAAKAERMLADVGAKANPEATQELTAIAKAAKALEQRVNAGDMSVAEVNQARSALAERLDRVARKHPDAVDADVDVHAKPKPPEPPPPQNQAPEQAGLDTPTPKEAAGPQEQAAAPPKAPAEAPATQTPEPTADGKRPSPEARLKDEIRQRESEYRDAKKIKQHARKPGDKDAARELVDDAFHDLWTKRQELADHRNAERHRKVQDQDAAIRDVERAIQETEASIKVSDGEVSRARQKYNEAKRANLKHTAEAHKKTLDDAKQQRQQKRDELDALKRKRAKLVHGPERQQTLKDIAQTEREAHGIDETEHQNTASRARREARTQLETTQGPAAKDAIFDTPIRPDNSDAEHLYSIDEIRMREDVREFSPEELVEVYNVTENLAWLHPSVNRSKGSRPWSQFNIAAFLDKYPRFKGKSPEAIRKKIRELDEPARGGRQRQDPGNPAAPCAGLGSLSVARSSAAPPSPPAPPLRVPPRRAPHLHTPPPLRRSGCRRR